MNENKVVRSEHYYAPIHPEINRGMPGAATTAFARLRAAVRQHEALQYDLAVLEDSIWRANAAADFESGIELTAAYLDREHELALVEQEIWAELRKEFGESRSFSACI